MAKVTKSGIGDWWDGVSLQCGECYCEFTTEPGDSVVDYLPPFTMGRKTSKQTPCPDCGENVMIPKPDRPDPQKPAGVGLELAQASALVLMRSDRNRLGGRVNVLIDVIEANLPGYDKSDGVLDRWIKPGG